MVARGIITWFENHSQKIAEGRIMLFCIDNKCQSGKVIGLQVLSEETNTYTSTINFIETNHFKDYLNTGNKFLIKDPINTLGTFIIS